MFCLKCFKKYFSPFPCYTLLLLILGLLAGCVSERINTGFGERPDVQYFIQKIAIRDNFNARHLTALFNQVEPRPVFVHNTRQPRETAMTWQRYRAIFIQPERIALGVAFWRQHEAAFEKAEQTYGVEPQVIIAILGVETEYGKYPGKYRVMDSLSTLAFNYPRRAAFFQNELEQYLLLTRELHIDPLNLYGSYAGAVGLPQFMPSNYRRLAVSYHSGKSPDLWHNGDDAILSIADYFYHKGWQIAQPVAIRIPRYNANAVVFGNQYWLLYPNFHVIKRYNDSNFYAMTVYQLSEAIRQEKDKA